MPPITFTAQAHLRASPIQVADAILDLSNWPDFTGYGPLPGIESAEFIDRTPEVLGSRIQVKNTDGSTHVEEIVEWEPNRRLSMTLSEFSPPLSYLASSFDEVWAFHRQEEQTFVTRSFYLHPKNTPARIVLWFISFLLKRAIELHLRRLQDLQS